MTISSTGSFVCTSDTQNVGWMSIIGWLHIAIVCIIQIMVAINWSITSRYITSTIHMHYIGYGIMFNATFNNISIISWQSVLLVEETDVHGGNHLSVASHCETLSHIVVSTAHRMSAIRTHNWCIGSCQSNYHKITTTTVLVGCM
jgi:hypothetical protein